MPRGKPIRREQLDDIVGAATRVFVRNGFRRTRMADVATEAGLSPGALYTYVESKEALFHLVTRGATDGDGELTLPVATPAPETMVAAVRARLTKAYALPRLTRARRSGAPADAPAELAAIIGEMYDAVAANRTLLAVIERSASDVPGLAEQYYRRGRRGYVGQLSDYLTRRIGEGAFRPLPDVAVAARYLLEGVAWFAWHRLDDPDSAMIDDAAARCTVIDMSVAALAPRGVDR